MKFLLSVFIFLITFNLNAASDSFFIFKAGYSVQGESKSQDTSFGLGTTSDPNPEALKVENGRAISLGLEYWQNRYIGLGFDYRKFRKRKTMADLHANLNGTDSYLLGIAGNFDSVQLVLDLLVRYPIGKGTFTVFGGYGIIRGDGVLKHDTSYLNVVSLENIEEQGWRYRFGLEYFFSRDSGLRLNFLNYSIDWKDIKSVAIDDDDLKLRYSEYLLEYIYIFK